MPVRPIDANELKRLIASGDDLIFDKATERELLHMIDYQPTIEAEPVRHGRWIPLNGWMNKGIVKCSECGNTLDMDGVNAGRGDANSCPNCSARMDGGADNG